LFDRNDRSILLVEDVLIGVLLEVVADGLAEARVELFKLFQVGADLVEVRVEQSLEGKFEYLTILIEHRWFIRQDA